MRIVKNESFYPIKLGDRIKLGGGRWAGARKVIAIIPCQTRYDCKCMMGRQWVVLEQFPDEDWDDLHYPKGITFCYECLGDWSFAHETST